MSSDTKSDHATRDVFVSDEWAREFVERGSERRASHRRSWLVHRALAAADAIGLLTAFFLTISVFPGDDGRLGAVGEFVTFALLLPLWVLLAKLHGLYDQDEGRTDRSTVDDITGVFNVVTVGTWLFFLAAEATGAADPSLQRAIGFWASAIVLVPVSRAFARALCRRSAAYVQNTVVVGTGPVGRQIAQKILAHPEYGLNLVGFVDRTPTSTNGAVGGLPILGSPDELDELVPALDLERVIVSFMDDGPESALAVVRGLRNLDVQVDIVPRLYEAFGPGSTVHMVEGVPLVGLPPVRLSPSSRFLKRSLDLVGAGLGLILLSPVFVGIAIATKLDSRGPVFFRQVRRGERGGTFRIFKFRTMNADADTRKLEVAHLNMHLGDDSRMFKIPDDPRATTVGRFLRRWSLDEVPQLINVLMGEMSLVGPRPLVLEEADLVQDWARKRLELRPGMTGLWQVLGRSDISFAEMTKLDYLYVTSWSLKQDVRLILLTLPSLFRSRRAY